MTKGTKTLLYVLGGLTVVGAGGTAIYLTTKKPAPGGASGDNTVVPPQGNNPEPTPTTPSSIQTTSPEINSILSLAQMIAELTKKPDFGQVNQGL